MDGYKPTSSPVRWSFVLTAIDAAFLEFLAAAARTRASEFLRVHRCANAIDFAMCGSSTVGGVR